MPESVPVSFEAALVAMKVGRPVRRSTWPAAGDPLVLMDGHILTKIGRIRVHSFPIGDILATDWVIL